MSFALKGGMCFYVTSSQMDFIGVIMEKIRRVLGTMFLSAWAAAGCGRNSEESRLHTGAQELEFTQWCQEWQLQCPVAAGDAAQANKMRATLALAHAALDGESQLKLDRAKIDHGTLATALDILGWREDIDPLLQKLKEHGWNEVRIMPKAHQVELGFVNPHPLQTKSGLKWHPADIATVAMAADGQLLFEGVHLNDAVDGRREKLRGTAQQGADYAHLWGDELRVKNVPPSFLQDELDIVDMDADSPSTKQVAGALRPLTEWLLLDHQQAHVHAEAFDVLHREVDALTTDEEMRSQVRVFASALDSVRANAVAGDKLMLAAQQRAKAKLACQVQGSKSLDIKFDNAFGLEEARLLNGDAVQTKFYGIEVKAKVLGPIKTTIKLKRVDIYEDKAVIHNVPVIGTYTIRFDDFRSAKNTFACTN